MRLRVFAAVLIAVPMSVILLSAAPAMAKEGPLRVTITGPGLTAPLVVRQETNAMLVMELDGLGTPHQNGPAARGPERPGPAYLLVMEYRSDRASTPRRQVEIYPHASTGGFMLIKPDSGASPWMPAPAPGWYRTWADPRRPLTQAGVPLPPPPWQISQPPTAAEAQTQPPVATGPRPTAVAVAGLIGVAALGILALVRRRRPAG